MTTPVEPATIRTAEVADRAIIQSLWRMAGLEPATPEEWVALVDDPRSAVLVAERQAGIVGAAIAAFDGWRAFIYHVAVDPDYRHLGIGGALIEEAERYLTSAGARCAFVMVHEDNTDGLALVGQRGYLPEGEIVLTKALTPV